MNRSLLCLLLIVLSFFNLRAQELKFTNTEWEDPSVFEKGQNAPHAFHLPYNTVQEALQNDKKNCSNLISLNGNWKFLWSETPESAPEKFWETGFDVSKWASIEVPSNWQMKGFGHAKFRNVALSFESDPPNIPDYYNPTGCYKLKFTIPENWRQKEIMLRFEGINSAAYIWINGKRVGYNEGAFEPAEFNISSFISPGENDLSVKVLRFSDGSYLENQDMWQLSGIFRDVKLYAQNKSYIHDYYIISDLDKNYKDVTLSTEVDVRNSGTSPVNRIIEIDVLDETGKSVLGKPAKTPVFAIGSQQTQKVSLSSHITNPPKWSAEFPNLFTMLFVLKTEDGEVIEAFTTKTGFREVEYNNNILTVNGIPVKLNGVNSHMHHPKHGQTVPLETLKKDLLLMKQFNINCVRTCHYPPSPEYLDLANELGMYIFDEVGDEAHSNTHLSRLPEWTEMYKDRSRKLVYRDRNHPSVIVWSAGNESGPGENINEVIITGKAIDPSRPAWMYGGNKFYIPFEDLVGPRYWIPLDYKNMAEGKILPENDMRASFMDEYLAATGNGLGGMDEYWELIWKHPRLSGGAIWDWISPGIKTPRWEIPDLSGNNNNGQVMGRPEKVQGKSGMGIQFTGHDDWIEFYRDPSLNITGNELSIGFWVKATEIPQINTFVTKGKHQYGIVLSDPETLEFYIYNRRRISAKASIREDFYNKWHHVAGIYNGRELQLYIDEQLVAQTDFDGNISPTPFPLCIGREAETQDQGEFSGRMSEMTIDQVKIFDKAVSVADLKSNTPGAVLEMDFEKDQKEGSFQAVGLGGRTYGIIWPDRTIQPEIHQIKKSGQPVLIEAIDIKKGEIRITNRHHFKNLSELAGHWELSLDGKALQNGNFKLDLPAGATSHTTIPYLLPEMKDKSEGILTVSFCLKNDLKWAKTGHEIAWEQFCIKKPVQPAEKQDKEGSLNLQEDASEIKIQGSNFTYILSKKSGTFTSLQYNNREYIENEPAFNVWRAPIANDIDPWGSYMFKSKQVTPGYGRSIDNQLRTLGLRDLSSQADEIEVLKKSGSSVMFKVKAFSNSSIKSSYNMTKRDNNSAFERNELWTIEADGTIHLEQEIIPHGAMPEMLQKIGLQFKLPKAFNQIEWFGRGPFETYPDRKTGAKVGLYQSNTNDMYVPYIIPQEYGNRTDVRWLKVGNGKGQGLLIKSDDLLNFSLHKYSTDNLSRANYTYQLKEAQNTILNIDYEVSGVGGTAIRQLQKYRVKPHVGYYNLTIKPF